MSKLSDLRDQARVFAKHPIVSRLTAPVIAVATGAAVAVEDATVVAAPAVAEVACSICLGYLDAAVVVGANVRSDGPATCPILAA